MSVTMANEDQAHATTLGESLRGRFQMRRDSASPRAARQRRASRGRVRLADAALGIAPTGCAAVEDSTNGLRAARAGGMRVIAVPNRDYLSDPDDLVRADAVIESLDDLSEAVVDLALR
ncbi:MAG: hypothetical protein ACRDIL_06850 [Candidatus Limnocylindrales bacterium]